MTNTAMLPLDGERAVTFRDKGQQFTYYFNRISDADYRNRYFPGLSVSSENAGGTMLTRVDVWTPAEYLFAAAIARVEGYKLRPVDGNDGSGDLMQLADWKDKLPHGHRQKAMDILLDVTASEAVAGEEYFDPDCQEVRVDAFWGIDVDASNLRTNRRYRGLAHRFRPPSAEHSRKYNRAAGESRLEGGSRRNRTIYAGKHGLMADLYDELVISVDGYSIGGSPLGDAAQVKKEMDTFHKVAALRLLFAAPDDGAAVQEEAA
jgi:hypothetical protein